MAFEQLKAQIGMLLGEMNEQPEDLHELYQQIHQELNQSAPPAWPFPPTSSNSNSGCSRSFRWRRTRGT